jgi:hypothetical protein
VWPLGFSDQIGTTTTTVSTRFGVDKYRCLLALALASQLHTSYLGAKAARRCVMAHEDTERGSAKRVRESC